MLACEPSALTASAATVTSSGISGDIRDAFGASGSCTTSSTAGLMETLSQSHDNAMLALNDWQAASSIRTAESERQRVQICNRKRRDARDRLETLRHGHHSLPQLMSWPTFPVTYLSSHVAASSPALVEQLLLPESALGPSILNRSRALTSSSLSSQRAPGRLAPIAKAEPAVPRTLPLCGNKDTPLTPYSGDHSRAAMIGVGRRAVSYW